MMSRTLIARSIALVGMAAPFAPAATLIYTNNADTSVVKSYSTDTSATATYTLGTSISPGGLAADDANQRLYVASGTGGTTAAPTNNLFTYDYSGNLIAQTRITYTLGSFSSFAPTGLTFANGTLYATKAFSTSGRSGVYAVNPLTGLTTLAAAFSDVDPPAAPSVNANPLDIDFDAANNRFITTNGIVSSPSSARGLYAFTLPTTPGGLVTTTFLAGTPPTQPTGTNQPDGIAIDGNIAYLTYNRSNVIARFDLTTNTYLSNVTGAAQTDGASGDAAFATGFVPEPGLLALLPAAAVAVLRRRRSV